MTQDPGSSDAIEKSREKIREKIRLVTKQEEAQMANSKDFNELKQTLTDFWDRTKKLMDNCRVFLQENFELDKQIFQKIEAAQLEAMIDAMCEQEIKQTTEKKLMDNCLVFMQENLELCRQILQKIEALAQLEAKIDAQYAECKEIKQIQEDLLPQLKTMIDTLYKQEIKQTTEKKQMDKCRGSLQENLGLNKQIFQKTDDVKYKEIEQIQEEHKNCSYNLRSNGGVKVDNTLELKYQPEGFKLAVELTTADVETLEPGDFLNDKIMDFYLKYITYERLEVEHRKKLHVFSSFFYTRLCNASMDSKSKILSAGEKMHSRVKMWTRHVDLFSKDFIVIPICEKSHWYVVLVQKPGEFDHTAAAPAPPPARGKQRNGRSDLPCSLSAQGLIKDSKEIVKVKEEVEEDSSIMQPCIMVLDSLGIKRPSTVRKVRMYLSQEWIVKKDESVDGKFEHLPVHYPKIPLQHNSSDCGIYVLQFVETLVQCLNTSRPLPSTTDEWGTAKVVNKRSKIRDLIVELKSSNVN